jgi:hypothetical protein
MTVFQDTKRNGRVILLGCGLICSLTFAGTAPGQDAKPKGEKPELPVTVKQVLEWLPPDTETLVVTRGPFAVVQRAENPERKFELPQLVAFFESWSYSPLAAIREGVYLKKLAGCELVLAVEGARGFKSPASLGMFLYEGCHVLIFRDPLGPAGDALRKALTADAKKIEKMEGHEVFLFEETLEKDRWTFLIAQPKPNILLCATHGGYLQQVLQRMREKKDGRAFPDDLPEWKHVDTGARFWAIRHFTKDAPNDVEIAMAKPTGFTFSFDPPAKPGKEKPPKARVLLPGKDAVKFVLKAWTYVGERKWIPSVEQVAPGVVEITAERKNEGDYARFLYVLMFWLGHGVVV